MQCNFQVGQKVSYVPNPDADDFVQLVRARWVELGLTIPKEGAIYTVRAIRLGGNRRDGFGPVVLVEEIRNREVLLYSGGIGEPGFSPKNFRPVVERGTETGMSILRELLNKQNQPVREDA